MTDIDALASHHLDLDDPAEAIAYVPYRLGFQPSTSLVVLSVREHASGVTGLGLVARADLADLDDPALGPALRSDILGHLAREDCVAAWLFVYSDSDLTHARRTAERITAPWWDSALMSPTRCHIIADRRWACLHCAHEPACPETGRDRCDLIGTAIAAAMVLHGMGVAGSRDQLVTVRAGTAEAMPQAQEHRWRGRKQLAGCGNARERTRWRRRCAQAWDRAIGHEGATPTPDVCGRLLAGLDDLLLRDAIITAAMVGGRVATVVDRRGAVDDAFDSPRMPQEGRIRPIVSVLEEVLRHSSPEESAPAWATLAWIAWWLGDGAKCDVLLNESERADPDYRLAALLRKTLDGRLPPPWVERASGHTFEG